MSVITHLDVPAGGSVTTPASAVHGWIAVAGMPDVRVIGLVNDDGACVPLAPVDRADVRAANPGTASSGFTGWIDLRLAARGPWRLRYDTGGATRDVGLPLHADRVAAERFGEVKARKLERVRPLLRCAMCRRPLRGARDLVCENGHRFERRPDAFDLLTPELRVRVGADPTDNVSAHGYDPILDGLIARTGGVILDVGAGLRPDYREDVINVEIVDYPTTDVVAAGEYLPFADESVDLIVTSAVLEHVRDPFAAANEMQRVLKPGGRVYAAVPFLQPYHGYPHHYYNMTAAGLRNLFTQLDVESLDVPAAGRPIFSLTWILRAWRDALPADVARAFETMRVADLVGDPATYLDRPFVRDLPEPANEQLAAVNVLIARKPEGRGGA